MERQGRATPGRVSGPARAVDAAPDPVRDQGRRAGGCAPGCTRLGVGVIPQEDAGAPVMRLKAPRERAPGVTPRSRSAETMEWCP